MRFTSPLLAAGLLLSLTTLTAEASLTSYTANGVDLVRMQGGGFDVSFTKDGNLFKTLAGSYAGGASAFVSAVIASVPNGKIIDTANYYDTPANSGYHTLSSSDFNTSTSTVSWFGAKAYVSYLNSISYAGSTQWSLPGVADTGTAGCNYANSGTDCGYNVNPSTDPLAQLYFAELGKKSYLNTSGVYQSGHGIFGNNGVQVAGGAVGPFANAQSSAYWSDTEYAPYPGYAWNFSTSTGSQYDYYKSNQSYAWAVSPGQVAAVPVPGAVWLFGTGLVGWLGLKRRGHAG